MGRVERAAWGVGGRFVVFLLACVPFLWPIMFLPHSTGWPAAWGIRAAWGVFLIAIGVLWWQHEKAKTRERVQAQIAYEDQLAQYRAHMARSGQPWFDAAAGHFRHGTCTIKHRSEGAAGRCSSTI